MKASLSLSVAAAALVMTMHGVGSSETGKRSKPCAITPNYTYAQELIDDTVARHPELTALVMHVTPPGSRDNVIIASNIWLTGQKSDDDDIHVITSGIASTETNKAGTKFEVELVLRNVAGATIGSVAAVFPYKAGQNKTPLEKRAGEIRDELSRRIVSPENLLDPFPYDPQIPSHTYAQKLVDQAMAKYAEIMILAIHATPPNGTTNVILASNVGRIGKKSEADELEVSRTGEARGQVRAPGDRYEAILPLKDRTSKTIGTINMLLPVGKGAGATQAKLRAEHIAEDISSMIPSLATLFEPVRVELVHD